MRNYHACLSLLCLSLATPASAQIVHGDDVVINGAGTDDQLCIGDNCADDEVFSNNHVKLRLKDNEVAMEFNDVNSIDWMLEANAGGQNFVIRDLSTSNIPFKVQAVANANSLVLAPGDLIGMGTDLPEKSLHIVRSTAPTIRMESTASGISKWDVTAAADFFYISQPDIPGSPIPLVIERNAPARTLYLSADGDIGLGTAAPNAPLEVSSDETFSFFRLTASEAATNESVDFVFTEGPLGTGQLRYNIVEVADSPQVPEMTLDANGNMTLTGTLTTAGPTCAGGCDQVFDAGYPLPSLNAHQAQMWAEGYLPGVGPTPVGQKINVTEQMGRMLNELEHAHIYIGQLNTRINDLTRTVAALQVRLEN